VHIPRPFSDDRPPIHFTKDHYDVRMSEHPEAAKLPAAAEGPAMFPGPSHYASLALGPGAPRNLDDYLYSDVPQFALHVVTFEDGTLVSINFNHITSDLSGLRSILDAWQLHLAGNPEAKAEFMSMHDGMRPLYEAPPSETHVIADVKLSGWGMINQVVRFMWDSWWIPYESRTVCIPKTTMDTLLQNARNHVPIKPSGGQQAPFITEGDVLLALSVRLAAHNLPRGSNRIINTIIAVDPRGRAKSVFLQGAAYVQNAPSGALISCPASQALDMKLGELALHMRKAIALQTTEEQLKAAAFELASSIKKTGRLPMYGDSKGLLATSSNWSKANLLESVDFSPAIVKQRGTTQKPGRPVYYHSRSLDRGAFSTSTLIIMGRDHKGNMWLTGDYPDATWLRLMDFLKSQ
jgi:hypothetical protein